MSDFDFSDMPSTYEGVARSVLSGFRAGEVIVLSGQGGSGLTMIARRSAGFKGSEAPFRAPHHTVSLAGLKSELSMAGGGVLFLDEAVEFRPRHLDHVAVAVRDGLRASVVLSVPFPAEGSARNYSESLRRALKPFQDREVPCRVVMLPIYESARQFHDTLREARCASTEMLLAS